MFYCCGCYIRADRELHLYDNVTHKDRVLEIATCPKCGTIKVHVIQTRIEDGKVSERKPKNTKEVGRFIKKYEKEAYWEIPDLQVKYGSKNNMCWYYSDVAKSSWVKDFNGVRQFKVNKACRISK